MTNFTSTVTAILKLKAQAQLPHLLWHEWKTSTLPEIFTDWQDTRDSLITRAIEGWIDLECAVSLQLGIIETTRNGITHQSD